MTRQYSFYTEEELKKEKQHRAVWHTMENLDRLSSKVAIGFVIYWTIFALLVVGAVVHFVL